MRVTRFIPVAFLLPVLAAHGSGHSEQGMMPADEPAATAAAKPATSSDAVSDSELGLHKASVFAVDPPPLVPDNTSDPGERPLPARPSVESPPVIPHAIVDFLPITRSDNLCIDCHEIDEKEVGEPTPIPQSHYIDWRNAPGTVRSTVAGSRWVCVSCHVSQTDAVPLVGNSLAARD